MKNKALMRKLEMKRTLALKSLLLRRQNKTLLKKKKNLCLMHLVLQERASEARNQLIGKREKLHVEEAKRVKTQKVFNLYMSSFLCNIHKFRI